MNLTKSVLIGTWMLLGLNLLMALGAILIFGRISPALATAIERNDRSVEACEQMLTEIALAPTDDWDRLGDPSTEFRTALEVAQANVTEEGESEVIERIEAIWQSDAAVTAETRMQLIQAINELSLLNRNAMIAAESRARRLGWTGAWTVAFMAGLSFIIGLVYMRTLHRQILEPVEEIRSVVEAHRHGDTLRRCSLLHIPPELRALYRDLNAILDQCSIRLGEPGFEEPIDTA